MLFSRLAGYIGYGGNICLCAKKKHTVPKEIHFSWYKMKFSGENVILRGIVHVVSCFPLHFMLYRGNLDYFSDSVQYGFVSRYIQLICSKTLVLDFILKTQNIARWREGPTKLARIQEVRACPALIGHLWGQISAIKK